MRMRDRLALSGEAQSIAIVVAPNQGWHRKFEVASSKLRSNVRLKTINSFQIYPLIQT